MDPWLILPYSHSVERELYSTCMLAYLMLDEYERKYRGRSTLYFVLHCVFGNAIMSIQMQCASVVPIQLSSSVSPFGIDSRMVRCTHFLEFSYPRETSIKHECSANIPKMEHVYHRITSSYKVLFWYFNRFSVNLEVQNECICRYIGSTANMSYFYVGNSVQMIDIENVRNALN